MKDIKAKINEGYKDVEFTVAFSGATDEDHIPFSVRILVDSKYKEEFKKYLEKEKDNSVYMAEDWNGDPIGEDYGRRSS